MSSAADVSLDEGNHEPEHGERDTDEISQEEKPRSRIIAEYLAHGYVRLRNHCEANTLLTICR